MAIEQSHGKARPTLPRASDLAPVDLEGTARERRRNHGPDGRTLPGNDLARGRGWKRAARKALGRDVEGPVAQAIAEDAWRLFTAAKAQMPSAGALVEGMLALQARHGALAAYFAIRAAELGLDTAEGTAADARAVVHGQRAERLAVTALDLATKLATAKRQAPLDVAAANRRAVEDLERRRQAERARLGRAAAGEESTR